MTNENFILLTERERKEKLKAVLGTKSEGNLTQNEIREIVRILPKGRQYEVNVCHSMDEFCARLTGSGTAERRLVLGRYKAVQDGEKGLTFDAEAGAVVVTVIKHTDAEEKNQLQIFIPPDRFRKKEDING